MERCASTPASVLYLSSVSLTILCYATQVRLWFDCEAVFIVIIIIIIIIIIASISSPLNIGYGYNNRNNGLHLKQLKPANSYI